LDNRFIKQYKKYLSKVIGLVYFGLSFYYEKNANHFLIAALTMFLGMIVISVILYEGNLVEKIIIVTIYCLVWFTIQLIIMDTVFGQYYYSDIRLKMFSSIISQIILLALVKIIPLFMALKYCIVLIVLPLMSSILTYGLFFCIDYDGVGFTLILLIFLMNFFVYDVCFKILKRSETLMESEIFERQSVLFQDQIKQIEMLLLKALLAENNSSLQYSYIKELLCHKKYSQIGYIVDNRLKNNTEDKWKPVTAKSGNTLLDFIINSKCDFASKNNIEYKANIEVPYKFPFSDGDICIILRNALDNAIEGALGCTGNRYVYVNVIYRKSNLLIQISNSYDGNLKRNCYGKLVTTKSAIPSNRGFGISLIERAVSKYNGLLTIDTHGKNFILTVLLYSA